MLFVIDIGNSHTVVGLYKDDNLTHEWRLKSDRHKTVDEIGFQFYSLFEISDLQPADITGIIIASVVPSLEAAWLSCCKKYFSASTISDPFIVSDKSLKSLIDVKIDFPNEVGADRLVNGIAAWNIFQTDVIVIDFGTAITFDCINKHCQYLGGTILPGVAISLEALSTRAAKLPHIDISVPPKSSIGKNTVDAMKSGILYGYGALIDGLVETLRKEFCTAGTRCNYIATGGMANLVIPFSKEVNNIDQLLTLKGLHHIYNNTR